MITTTRISSLMFKNAYHKIADFFKVKSKKSGNSITGAAFIKVNYKDVLYITKVRDVSNKVMLVTEEIELYDDRSLSEFCKKYVFFQRIGKSFVANVTKINKLSENLSYIWVGENIKLNVSRHYKQELKQKLEEYL